MMKLYFFLATVAILVASLQQVKAATRTWDGSNSVAWNLAANWVENAVPTSADDVIMGNFVPGNQPTLSGSTTILSLTINGRSATVNTRGAMLTIATGVTLTITGNLTINGSTGTGTEVQPGITASGTASVSVSGNLLTNNATAGTGQPTIIFGSGTLTVTGNFTLSTNTTFTSGTGTVDFNKASGTQTVNNGSGENFYNITHSGAGIMQDVTNAVTATNSFNNSGGGTVDIHALALTVGDLQGNGTITNSIAGTPLLTIGSDNGNSTFPGIIQNPSGTIALTKAGNGILTLSGLSTYTGITTISAGTVSINTLLNVNGGASSLGAPTTVANGTIAIGASGVLQYTGNGNTSDRVINLTGSGGTLDASGSGLTIFYLTGGVTGSGFNLVLTGTGFGYLSGIIAIGSGTVTKNGIQTWTLGGLNTYTGITTINKGIIKFGAHGNATGPLGTTAGGTIIASGGALDLAGWSENANETLSLNGSGTDTWGVLRNSGAADTYAGLITLTGPSYIDAYNGTIAITNTGTITGAGFGLTLGGTQGGTLTSILGTGTGTLTKIEAGTWTLSGANTFTGLTTVSAGTLMYGVNNALPSATVTVSAGTLDLSTYTQAARTGTLTVSDGAMYRIGGPNTLPTYSTGYSFGNSSTVEYYGTSQTVANQTYGNLTLSGSGGKTVSGNFTINGILNLSIANPSANAGLLDMGTYTLTMGASATTIGPGDVTGIVRRTSFVAATSYTFGNQYSTITFQNTGTFPTEMKAKITIGSAPAWKTDAVKRTFELIQTGAISCFATLNTHYLDSELNGNTEASLVIWGCFAPFTPGTAMEFGRSNYDVTNNWVGLSGVDISQIASAFNQVINTLGNSQLLNATWNGSVSTEWMIAGNWTPNGIPSDVSDIVIPGALSRYPTLISSQAVLVGRLTINSGGTLNAGTGSTITISGASGAWSNNGGTFNPSTSTVIFTNASATISGITDFYNVTVNSGAVLVIGSSTIMRIGGTITNSGTWNAALNPNTVEYNGGVQTVLNPNGFTPGYSSLILSGSGTKTMPATALNISGNFTMAGTASATAGSALTIGGNVLLGAGTFNASTFTHNVKGNWTNSGGTFTPGSSTINFNGTAPQTITGTNTFNNLTASLTADVTLGGSLITVSGALQINNTAKLTVPPAGQLTVGGTTTLSSANCLILKSDATGTGSFIDNGTISGSGTAKVERYLTTDKWHYISSPISNAIAAVFFGDYLMTSDPTTPTGWGPWIVYYATPLEVMRGYAVWKPYSNPGLESFSGTLNTGIKSITLNRDAGDPWAGWHLVGNPYASGIDLTSVGITWDFFEPTAYFWDQSGTNPAYPLGGNYDVYPAYGAFGTHSPFAPATQGFFVHIVSSHSGLSTLTMTNGARVHNSETFLKDGPAINNALLIIAQSSVNSYSDKLTVHFNENATSGYDPGYDAYKLWGSGSAPQIYTRIGTTNVTCNSLPFEQKNMIIPMGFSCGLPGNYTLIADSLGTFDEAISVSLEDLKLSTTQNLRSNPVYNFTYDTIDDANRFLLHFDNPTFGGKDLKNILPVQIYSFGSSVYIKSSDGKILAGDVCIYDMIGKELYLGKLVTSAINRITPVIASGYYMVKVVTNDGVYSAKIYLAN